MTHTNAAFCSQICLITPPGIGAETGSPPNRPKIPTEMASGTMNCAADTPRFPNLPFRPSAEPLRSLGKKKLMFWTCWS